MGLDPLLPSGPVQTAWQRCQAELPLISPQNKRRLRLLVVATVRFPRQPGRSRAVLAGALEAVPCSATLEFPKRTIPIARIRNRLPQQFFHSSRMEYQQAERCLSSRPLERPSDPRTAC
jgi:hypothetical protein